eukprot:1159157-Pelagomonas_calceolata.AAC.3
MGHGMLIWHPQTHVHPGKRAVLAVQHAEGCNACPLSRKYVVCVCARVHARAPARRVCAHISRLRGLNDCPPNVALLRAASARALSFAAVHSSPDGLAPNSSDTIRGLELGALGPLAGFRWRWQGC